MTCSQQGKRKFVVGYNGGITGPNAALTVHMDWETCLKYFTVISEPYGGYNRLIALVPNREDDPGLAEKIVEFLNRADV